MTVSSTTVKNSYSGNGSTTQFAYGYKIFADSDLIVIIRSSTGTETVKTLTTHYTVAGAGDASGGSITFTTGNTPASGETVVIIREVPQTQAIDYIANDPFPAESHEEGLDRGTMTTQQVQEEVDRSLKLSRTNTMTSTEFTVGATDRANKVLSFDSSGELAVTQELGTFRGNWSASTAYQVRDLVKDTSTNNIFMANTAHTSSGSQPLTSNTDSAKWDLIVDAATATSSATAAASSATAAASSATASANSATASANSATTSGNSATAAASSATAAATSATEAAASADAFDDIYLGSKSSDPSTDNDGDALAAGMLYFNTTNDILRVYSGSAWQDAALSSTGVVTLTGTQTLTNKTLTAPVINSPTGDFIKIGGTNFTDSLLVGHATTGTLSSAENNTGVGINALDAITSGDLNTVKGYNSASSLTTGRQNVAIGAWSLKASDGAVGNTAIGTYSQKDASGSAQYNSSLGYDALQDVTGTYNIGIGKGAGANILGGDGNVVIGNCNADSATGSRQLKIAGYDGTTTTTWISGSSAGVVTFNSANVTQQALTSSSNAVAWDASAKPNAVHVTTENTTFSAPTNNVEGAFIALEINYNGSHTIAFNTVFEFAASTAPTFTSADGKTDILVFRYNGAVWQEVGRTLNLSES